MRDAKLIMPLSEDCTMPDSVIAETSALSTISSPTKLDQLSRQERVVALALRHAMHGICGTDSACWSHLWTSFAPDCGVAAARKAAGALAAFIRQLATHATRQISYHQPLCPCLGEDEHILLKLIALTQHRDWRNASALARHYVHEDGIGDIIAATSRLTVVLSGCRLELPINNSGHRVNEPSPAYAAPGKATLH
ncbi:MAG TPA: hypothetical protein DCO73_10480 [Alphaproteobacteria bacterium]|nr:hypothetical protein [Alphaproteobacteria bacterium]